jgi:hypothetical protein
MLKNTTRRAVRVKGKSNGQAKRSRSRALPRAGIKAEPALTAINVSAAEQALGAPVLTRPFTLETEKKESMP